MSKEQHDIGAKMTAGLAAAFAALAATTQALAVPMRDLGSYMLLAAAPRALGEAVPGPHPQSPQPQGRTPHAPEVVSMSANTFHCSPLVCPPCGNAAEQIQRAPVASWGDRIDQLAEPARECVRDYLRGIWMRGQVIARAKT